ncbi:toprim domain-containing protein [Azospirillum sp. A29]|uniref:DUF7146 domain-containing protein n=1 Tax=Azospirillum sp. A29 TaxID=3160606 RepID=UPI00366AC179
MIEFVRGLNRDDALEWAREWLGEGTVPASPPVSMPALEESSDAAKRKVFARQLWGEATSIVGTPAECYLTQHRMIPAEAINALVTSGDCPVRFHPTFRSHSKDRPFPALLFAASDRCGVVHAVQGVRLTNTAEKLPKDAKRTVGPLVGAAVRLSGVGELILAEGPETGLSVWAATQRPIWIALGSIAKLVDMVPTGPVTVARDADAEGSAADIKLVEAVRVLHHRGRKVTVVSPSRHADLKKTDWNDVLVRHGLEAIDHAFAGAVPWRDVCCALPYYPAPTEPRDAALDRQRATIRTFFESEAPQSAFRQELQRRFEAFREADRAKRGWTDFNDLSSRELAAARRHLRRNLISEMGLRPRRSGRRLLLTGSQGSGKSSAAAAEIAGITQALIVWWVVPTLAKAEEQAADYHRRAEAGSMPVMVIRGRSSRNPEHVGKAMCPRHMIVERAGQHGINARVDICPKCPLRDECGYLRQEELVKSIDKRGLFLMAHEYLFSRSPAPDPGLVVADEAITITAVQEPISFTPDRITEVAGFAGGNLDEALGVRSTLHRVREVLESRRDILAGLREIGFDDQQLAKAIAYLEDADQRRKPSVNGSMTDSAITAVLDSFEKTETKSVVFLLRRLQKEMSIARSRANTVVFKNNAEVLINGKRERQPRVFIHWLKTPQISADIPMLLLDGTADDWLNRALFGKAMEHIHVPVERCATVTGTRRKLYSRRSFTIRKQEDCQSDPLPHEPAAVLRQAIATIVSQQSGPVFVSASKKVLTGLQPDLPTDTRTGHYNAVRGINDWEDCRTAIIIGREQPSTEDLEALTRAFLLTDPEPLIALGEIIQEENVKERRGWLGGYVLQSRGRRMRDGTIEVVEVQTHPDPRCQRVLEQIREAEIAQAADRVRPIFNERRILLLNELACDFTYDQIVSHKELVAGGNRLHQAFARTGGAVLLLSASEQSRLFNDLWPTEKAAKRDRERSPEPLFNILFGKRGFIQVAYRIGERCRGKPFRALIQADLADPCSVLEAVVGPVSVYSVISGKYGDLKLHGQ